MMRRPHALAGARKTTAEHHGCRISIRREEATEGDGLRSVEVQAIRGAQTPRDLDGYAFWWLDRWAEAEPGTLFYARLAENGMVARVRVPADFPPIPLPETSAEYDAKVREEYLTREKEHEAAVDKRARRVLAECDRMLERGRHMREANTR